MGASLLSSLLLLLLLLLLIIISSEEPKPNLHTGGGDTVQFITACGGEVDHNNGVNFRGMGSPQAARLQSPKRIEKGTNSMLGTSQP